MKFRFGNNRKISSRAAFVTLLFFVKEERIGCAKIASAML